MRDQAHPFPFDAQAELVMKAFMKATGERLDQARRQVGGSDEVQRFSHGGSWQSHHSYAPDRVDQMQRIEHETRLCFEDIMEGRLDVIERTVDQIIGMTATLEPNSVTVQQSQNRLKVAGQDGLIDIQISAFGIGVESLDRAQVRRSRVVSPVPEFELDVDERNEYGQRRRITSLYKQR